MLELPSSEVVSHQMHFRTENKINTTINTYNLTRKVPSSASLYNLYHCFMWHQYLLLYLIRAKISCHTFNLSKCLVYFLTSVVILIFLDNLLICYTFLVMATATYEEYKGLLWLLRDIVSNWTAGEGNLIPLQNFLFLYLSCFIKYY